jgi:hypothetical protein
MAKKPQSDKASLFRGREAAEYISPEADVPASPPPPLSPEPPVHETDLQQVEPYRSRRSRRSYGPRG